VAEMVSFQILMAGRSKMRDETIRDLANQWIVRQQADAVSFPHPSAEDVDNQYAQIVKQLPSPKDFENRCAAVGISQSEIRDILQRRLYMTSYLDARFRHVSQVDEKQTAAFYLGEFAPNLKARGEPVPPLKDVEPELREMLVRREINTRSVQWLNQMRSRFKINVVAEAANQ
jgi:hypothetical protein